jgi:2-isopropylmalate synthase
LWTTVGVHANVVEASWLAMVDALTYASLRRGASTAVPAAVR